MKRIREMHALLTGGSRGLGPTIAGALLREGARVTLTARTADALEAVANDLSCASRPENRNAIHRAAGPMILFII